MIITDDQQWPTEGDNPFGVASTMAEGKPEGQEEPLGWGSGGAWKLVCFRDQWQQLCRDVDLCDDKLAIAAAEFASDSMPLGRYDELYMAFKKVFISLEGLSKSLGKARASLGPKLEDFTAFVRKYEEAIDRELIALQEVQDDVTRVKQERDHARAMYRQEVQYRGRVQDLADTQRKAKNEVLRLLDGTQRDRDRLLLLSVIEKEDAVAARSMVEGARAEQKRAEEVSKVEHKLKHEAEGVAKEAKKMCNTITRELDRVRRQKLQVSRDLEKEERANREFAAAGGNQSFQKIQSLQAQLKEALDARAEAIGRIKAAEDAATEAKTKQRADMRVRQQLDLDAEDAEEQMKQAEDLAAQVAERANALPGVTEERDKLQQELNEVDQNTANLQANLKKAEEDIEQLKEETADLPSMRKRIEEVDNDVVEQKAALQKAQQEKDEISAKLANLKMEADAAEASASSLNKQLEQTQAWIADLRKKSAAASEELNKTTMELDEVKQVLSQEQQGKETALQSGKDAQTAIAEKEGETAAALESTKEATAERDGLKKQLQDMKTEIGQIQKEIGAEQKATAQAQRNGGKIAGKVESMQKNIDDLKRQADGFRAATAKEQAEHDKTRAALASTTADKEDQQSKLAEAKAHADQEKRNLDREVAAHKQTMKEYDRVKSKNEEDAAKAEARNGEIAEAQDKAEQAEQQLKTKQDEIAVLHDRIEQMKNEKEGLQAAMKGMKAAADRLDALMSQRIADIKSMPVDSDESYDMDNTYTTEYYKLQRERDEAAAQAQQSASGSASGLRYSGGAASGMSGISGKWQSSSSSSNTAKPSVSASSFEVKVAPGRIGSYTPPVRSSSSFNVTPNTPRSVVDSGPSIAPGTVGGGVSAASTPVSSSAPSSSSSYKPTATADYSTGSTYVAATPGDVTTSTTSDKLKHGGEVTWDYTKKGGKKVGGWMKDGYGAAKRKWG